MPIPWKKYLIGELSWLRLVRSIAFLYAFFAVYVYFRADLMIFLPQPSSYQDDRQILQLPTAQGNQLSAIHLKNPKAQYTLLYIHGNAEDLGDIRPRLEEFQQWGFNVFAYDYRGYGTSTGKPTEKAAYEDVRTAYNHLTQTLKIPPNQIIIYGQSIGGGSATYLVSQVPAAGLILESTFTSAQ
jgi:abhydrolase domain-containing protein 17